jgi:hypothetical protein
MSHNRHNWINADTFGIAASIICVIHCLALPVLAMTLPTLALEAEHGHMAHFILAGFVVAFCLFAIIPGYRQHRHNHVLYGMVTGVGLVLFATFFADSVFGPVAEMPIITLGNFIVVAAHLRNRRLLAARCC